MTGHAQLEFVMTECSKAQIRLTRPILKAIFEDSQYFNVYNACHYLFSLPAMIYACGSSGVICVPLCYFLDILPVRNSHTVNLVITNI